MEVPGTTSRAGRVCLIVHCRPATNATLLLTQAYKSEKACMCVENGSGEQEAVQTKESVVTRARKDSRNGMGASEFVTRWCARPVNEVQDKDAGRVEVVMDENNLRGRYSSKRVHAAHTITNLHVIFVYEMYICVCHSATCGENILPTGDCFKNFHLEISKATRQNHLSTKIILNHCLDLTIDRKTAG